jgi:hypothetical protein
MKCKKKCAQNFKFFSKNDPENRKVRVSQHFQTEFASAKTFHPDVF